MNEFYDLVLAPTRVKSTQYILLRSIQEAGEITQSHLGERLGVTTETLSRRLASLKAVGWVELRPCRNRRERLYGMTSTGKIQLENALPYWTRAENRLCDSLTNKEWNSVLRSLRILAQAAKNAESSRISNVLPIQQRGSADVR